MARIQAPMAGTGTPALAATVSNAGGLARKIHKKSSKAAFIFCKLLVFNKIS
jgi:NAD(P)H-dependent flavin oxidoreductase YrpB (nitropropane dioxygenase family)